MNNVFKNIESGGYFIGTCYDGEKLFTLLNSTDGKIEYIHESGRTIYSILKQYTTEEFKYDPENTDNMFGQQIDVYMDSIGQTILNI